MSRINRKIIIVLFLVSFLVISSQAQFIMQQTDYSLPLSYSLVPEDAPMDDETEQALFYMTIPTDKLKQAALAEGLEIQETVTTIYVDNDKFAAESNTEMGKMTVVSHTNDAKMYMIMWPQKRIVVMTADDMKNMKNQADAATEAMLKNLSPEMQAQIREAMAQEKKSKSGGSKITLKPTGKKSKISGYDCELYSHLSEEGQAIGVWASADALGITGKVEEMIGKFSKVFEMQDEEDDIDEWELVKGKIPIEKRTFDLYGMAGDPVFDISLINKIEKKTPPADKFIIPDEKDGFKKGSYSDMLNEMMQGQ